MEILLRVVAADRNKMFLVQSAVPSLFPPSLSTSQSFSRSEKGQKGIEGWVGGCRAEITAPYRKLQ